MDEPLNYIEWIDSVVTPGPDDPLIGRPTVVASLDLDDEDAAWSALIAHARAHPFAARGADEWDALLAEIDDELDGG